MSNGDEFGLVTKIGGAIIAVFVLPFSWLWAVANGAKRCASQAEIKAARAETKVNELKDAMSGMREAQDKGFDRLSVQIREVQVTLTRRIDVIVNGRREREP